ncbi:transcriptional repressor [Anaerobiospirillum sp. NML120448]|uniref:transcriptional repressor n=1 Tax=Anaerobiospirillum sp. NML120448 TaxID=2932816 RepID=UPI001FF58310|nr:transcriptional repressor [Anaerobiospirillum sp. NML120448]MCK0514446.1 transcriptional repressor [Anaerobiospirillum sp. NML120448]
MQNQDSVYSQIGDLTEETVQKLEQSGLRMTVQRRHIIDILTKSQCTSPKELWYEARQYVPDLGIATVYRLINRLEQIGVLAKTRNLGINRVMPQLGVITDVNGQVVRPRNNVQLSELIRLGLISHGVIGNNNKIEISLVGESINIVITS